MGFFKKLKFWRRRDGAANGKHSKKPTENLKEGDTNTEQVLRSRVAELQEISEKRDCEEANLRRSITECEETLEKKVCLKNQAEIEDNPFGLEMKLKEKDTERDKMEASYREVITVLEKDLQEAEFFKSEAEVKMCGLLKRLKEKDREMFQMEKAYREKIIVLEKKLEEKSLNKETEANLHALEEKAKEKDSERDKIEGTYNDKIIRLEKELEEGKCLKKEAEAKICGLENKLKEKDSERDKIVGTYRDKLIGLQKELEAAKCWKNEAEAKMCGFENKLKEKDIERDKMKATYLDKKTALKRTLKAKEIERTLAIRNYRTEIEAEMESTRFAEATLRSEKRVVEIEMEETKRHCRQVETTLHSQISLTEELERELEKQKCFQKEKVHDWKNVENALRSQIKHLKQTVSSVDSNREKVMDTLLGHMKAQQQTDGMYEVVIILNSQIKELDRKLQEQMNIHREEKRDWKNVERALRGQIKQLKIAIEIMESEK